MTTLTQLHLALMMGSFAIFLVSFFIGAIFLFEESRVKNHQPLPSWFRWVPSLEIMDRLHYRILTIGFLLLSLGMFTGTLLSKKLFGRFWTSDPRQLASIMTWGIYALFLNVRIRSGWRGRRGVLLSCLGFLTVIFIFFGIGHQRI